jgi:peptidylprolyl isomerase
MITKKSILFIFLLAIIYNCGWDKVKSDPTSEEPVLGELKIEDIAIGKGEAAEKNNKIVVHYKGWLEDKTVFANSYNSGNPLIVTLGIGELIKGWDQGLVGMRQGGIRKLTVPPHLGYGKRGVRDIPPHSTLYFEVKLINILH